MITPFCSCSFQSFAFLNVWNRASDGQFYEARLPVNLRVYNNLSINYEINIELAANLAS